MKIYCLVLVFVLLMMSSLFSQDSLINRDLDFNATQDEKTNTFALQSAYAKTGLFAGILWNSTFHKGWEVNMSLTTKVRHLSLNKFTPMISLGLGYDLFKNNLKVDFVPGLKGQMVSARLTESSIVNNVEMLFGYEFVLGEKFKLIQGAYFGLGHEDSQNFNIPYTSFLIHIGFGYALFH